jgi:hypothetical protein
MVHTNDVGKRLRLTIMGEVIPKSQDLQRFFHDTLGTVQTERTAFLFHTVQPKEVVKQDMWIRNFADSDVTLSIENVPEYLTVEAPGVLKSGRAERFKLSLDANKLEDRRGRLLTRLTWTAVDASGAEVSYILPVSLNCIDDFSAMSTEEKKNGPTAQFSTNLLNFGMLKKKGGLLGLGNRRVSQPFTIKNTGKSPLILHSVGSDDTRIHIAGLDRKTLRPEEFVTLTVTLRPKTIEGVLSKDIYIICNDPQGPVREVSVTAER